VHNYGILLFNSQCILNLAQNFTILNNQGVGFLPIATTSTNLFIFSANNYRYLRRASTFVEQGISSISAYLWGGTE